MFNDVFGEIGETLKSFPSEVGTEAVGQVKGNQKQANQGGQSGQNPGQAQQQQQQFLNDLYGTSKLTPDQIEMKKKQDGKIQINNYKKIQQEIQEYRAKKKQEKTKYEIGWQQGTDPARNQQEEMEMWEVQQKKAEERKKEEKKANMPGSAQNRGGEKGKIMG